MEIEEGRKMGRGREGKKEKKRRKGGGSGVRPGKVRLGRRRGVEEDKGWTEEGGGEEWRRTRDGQMREEES